MARIIVSQCLLGYDCRYKGDHCKNEHILSLAKDHVLIPICPEQMGGLSTPRDPSEIVGDKFFSNKGKDVTKQYQKGAQIALSIAQLNKADFAILKYRSPSCSKGMIYDGTFSGKLIAGNGITTNLFLQNNIDVFNENEWDEIKEKIKKLNETASYK